MRLNTPVNSVNEHSNMIFYYNNSDANRTFVTIRENTAAAPNSSLLNAKFTFKRTSTNHFRTDS